MEHATCGACGADDAFLLFTTPDAHNPASGELFPVGRCRRCGHVYVLERPTADVIGRYYAADYHAHRQTDPTPRKGSRRHRRIRLRAGDRILDVGCGSGSSLLRLKDRGYALFGVELDPEAAAQAQAHGITVFQGTAERANFPDAHFQQVTMNHCLEHFHDPGSVLANIRRMTKPEGSIYLAFPTAEGLHFRIFHGDWHHLDVPRHLQFFTHESFRRLVEARGLRIVHRACISGGRGFRRSLAAVGERSAPYGVLARAIHTKPLEWVVKATLKLLDGLRQGEIVEYVIRPA
jgi:SAM-dependent methyltransferase